MMRGGLLSVLFVSLATLVGGCAETPEREPARRPSRLRRPFTSLDLDRGRRSGGQRADEPVVETVEPLKGLVTRYYRLKNLDSATVRKLVELWKSKRGRVEEVKKSNLLVITDTPEHVAAMERVLERVDVYQAQVGIEATVVEIQDTDLYEYGFELRVDRNPVTKGSLVGLEGILPPQSFIDTLLPGGQANTAPFAFQGASMTLRAVGHLYEELGDTDLILRALQEEGYAKILSEPRIVVQSGEKASIRTLTRIPIEETSIRNNVTTITTRYQDVGVTLEVTPTIVGSDSVELMIRPEVSSLSGFTTNPQTGNVPVISTRNVSTRVRVRDGERIVIGGLYETRRVKKDRLIPGLGRLPLIGHLFRSRRSEYTRTEIRFMLKITLLDETRRVGWNILQPRRDR